jgi:hypothetical protein
MGVDAAERKLREFLYVDVQRVRSLLAQLDEGVAERAAQRYTFTDGSDLGPKLLRSSFAVGEQYEESKSLQDLVFCVFEDGAEAEGLLVDFPLALHEYPAWESGHAQGSLQEGQLLRVSAPILVVDPSFFSGRLERFTRFADALAGFAIAEPLEELRQQLDAEVDAAPNRDARRRAERERDKKLQAAPEVLKAAATATMGGATPETIASIAEFLTAFLGDTIADSRRPSAAPRRRAPATARAVSPASVARSHLYCRLASPNSDTAADTFSSWSPRPD